MAGVLWLTRDFRFKDNPALLAALADGPLLPVFFIDDQLLSQGAASRWRLERGLRAFDRALRARTGGIGVTILRGDPAKLLPPLLRSLRAGRVHQSDWPCPEMRQVQARVRHALDGIARLTLHTGHLLCAPQALERGGGGAYRVYTPFARALHRLGADRTVAEAPQKITAFSAAPRGIDLATLDLAPDLRTGRAPLDHFALPAGEDAAWERLDDFLLTVTGYPEGRDRPDLPATSELSEYLAVGEISARALWAAASLHAELSPAAAPAVQKFLSELIWREFAWHLLIDFPRMASRCWRPDWEGFGWQMEGPELEAWRQARTGAALVDAGLREMWLTGRMHNRVRMVTASFLTKHALTDWRAGLAHFAECLTDWDPAANAMNWQWVAGCGPDASPYFRIFNPELQAERHDPKGSYQRRWLADFDAEASPQALAYYAATPSRWPKTAWRPLPSAAIAAGRARALEALKIFRTSGAAEDIS